MRFSISFLSIILLYYGFLYRKGFQNSFSFMSCNWFSILSKCFFQRDIMLLNVFDKNGVCSGGSRISHEKKRDTDGFSDFLLKQQQTSLNRQGGSGGVGWGGMEHHLNPLSSWCIQTWHFWVCSYLFCQKLTVWIKWPFKVKYVISKCHYLIRTFKTTFNLNLSKD